MNIIYHCVAGGIGTIVTGSPWFFIGSIVPDIPMSINEAMSTEFIPEDVPDVIVLMYRVFHSLFILLPLYYINPYLTLGYGVHLLCDGFSHTGRFTWMPMYPIKWRFPWGKEILK